MIRSCSKLVLACMTLAAILHVGPARASALRRTPSKTAICPPMARDVHWSFRNRVPGECKGWGATTFIYARQGEFRMRLRVCDRIGNLRLLAIEINGVRVGVIDGEGLRSSGAPQGFDGNWGPWIELREAVRPGLNRVSLFPVGRKLAPEAKGQQSEWSGEVRFGRCRRVDTFGTMQGWGDVASVGEQVYEVLAELDEACRRPECYVSRRRYLDRRRWIHRRVKQLVGKGSTQLFFGIMNDFLHVTQHEKVDGSRYFDRWMELYDEVTDRQERVWGTPFALFVYGRNSQGRHLAEYLRDLSLARARSRRAFEALLQLPPNVDAELVAACHRALDEEKGRLRFLVDGIESVRMACLGQVETMRQDFPFWQRDFRRSFAAYLRQTKMPHPDYPLHGDLVREMALLNDYFDMVLAFARHDMEFLSYMQTGVEAMLSYSTRPLASSADPSRYLRRQSSAEAPGDPGARALPPDPRPRSHFPPPRRLRR